MRHLVKKIKFKGGYDANRILIRKLVKNFLNHDYLLTTITKAKVLKSYLDKIIFKTKKNTESNKNYLLRFLGDSKLVKKLFEDIGPQLNDINSGYVKIIKQNFRDNDGSLIAKVIWSKPVVNQQERKKAKEIDDNQSKKIKNKNNNQQ